MNLAICIDENYVMQAGVLITSIRETNGDTCMNIFILSESLSEQAKKSLYEIVSGSKITLCFNAIDLSSLPPLPLEGKPHLSVASYYRLLLPFILPPDIDRILYIDSDILVLDSLTPLFDADISEVNAAATIDMFNNDAEINRRLMYSPDAGYFNAGVMLMNLKNWRKNQISEKAIQFITEHPDKCEAHDQDALNHALDGSYLKLSARYNMQLDFFRDFKFCMIDESFYPDIIESRKSPCIIHFTGPTKPWLRNCDHPYTKLWDYFQDMTEWKGLPKKYEFGGYRLFKHYVKRVLKAMHLFKGRKPFLPETYVQADGILSKLKGERRNGKQ